MIGTCTQAHVHMNTLKHIHTHIPRYTCVITRPMRDSNLLANTEEPSREFRKTYMYLKICEWLSNHVEKNAYLRYTECRTNTSEMITAAVAAAVRCHLMAITGDTIKTDLCLWHRCLLLQPPLPPRPSMPLPKLPVKLLNDQSGGFNNSHRPGMLTDRGDGDATATLRSPPLPSTLALPCRCNYYLIKRQTVA